jgi:L-lactate dehydrogenase (cytochrome)
VRRASDIMKAVALGAEGVGLGRAVLYSYAAYGQAGLDKMVDILVDEMTMTMRLLGCPTVKQLTSDKVMVRDLATRSAPAEDHLANHNYIPMPSPVSRL